MKVEILEQRLSSDGYVGEQGDRLTVPDEVGAKWCGLGWATDLAGAVATTRWLEGQLFEVGPRDPLALAAVMAVLLVVSALASILPARRATAIDPSKALHDA